MSTDQELLDAIERLKTLLSEAQTAIGAISAFNYMKNKEEERCSQEILSKTS